MKKQYKILMLLFLILGIGETSSSCKKFVTTEVPATQINGANAFENDVTAISVLTGIYSGMSQGSPGPAFSTGNESFSLFCGLSSDEYNLFAGATPDQYAFYTNSLAANSTINYFGPNYWKGLYNYIYSVNNAIEGLTAATLLTDAVKKQLLGETKFIRALCYFYLVNLYGDAALVTSTDYKKNRLLARSSKDDIYKQIKKDLQDAVGLLSADYLDGKLHKYTGIAERLRPTKWAAEALLARAYLFTGDFTNAEIESGNVIDNLALYDTANLNNVFLKNSKEAIWQLQPVQADQITDDARMFILRTGFDSYHPVSLSDTLLNSFEPGDQRKVNGNWINVYTDQTGSYYYPYKYKDNTGAATEYAMVLRLAEQYLIRAEARAQLNKLPAAVSDLDVIRARAGLPLIAYTNPFISQAALLSKILHERQVELFNEWGHRWLDLKRTNTVDAVMSVITPKKANGALWKGYQKSYPLPFSELQTGSNLVQNPGYN